MCPHDPESSRNRIRQILSAKDPGTIPGAISDQVQQAGRRGRKDRIREINTAILETALELDRPEFLTYLHEISREHQRSLFSVILEKYIKTRDEIWFDAIGKIAGTLEKKSDQAEIQVRVCRQLIEAGTSQSDRALIDKGLSLINTISFRKYQSEILSAITPALIDWAVSCEEIAFLRSLDVLAGGVTDISGKSHIRLRIANAIAEIGVARNDPEIWAEGIRVAAEIRQKIRRQGCIRTIVTAAGSSPLFARVRDVTTIPALLPTIPDPVLHEVIVAILAELFSIENDRTMIRNTIQNLHETLPTTDHTVITTLLHQTEITGEPWFFGQAIWLQDCTLAAGEYPVRDFVRAALAVFRKTGRTDTLHQIIPAVVASGTPATRSRILLRIVQVLLDRDELAEALAVFAKTENSGERIPLYEECSTAILKHAISADRVGETREILAIRPGDRGWAGAIYHAVSDICRQYAFSEVSASADSLAEVMALHPQRDQLGIDSITILVQRGYLETADPDVLIRLTRTIGNTMLREQALSTIVVRLAKLGVATRSRDFLQRAVGLSCLIEGDRTRSQTLTAVIDEATILAVADGDIGLLRRMREWSASLLSREGEVVALANIIEGMITYAGNRRFPAALDEAYQVASEIPDPALKKEITDRIIESYVRIGVLLTQDLDDQPSRDEFMVPFNLFIRGLRILADRSKPEEQSLRIAHIIDIILDASKDRFRLNLLPALMLFILEIRQPFEKDAMAARIASLIRSFSGQPDSADPYETIVQVLSSTKFMTEEPVLIELLQRTVLQIKDPFTLSSQLCRLAGTSLNAGRIAEAREMLERVVSTIRDITGEYRQVILLAECTHHYTHFSQEQTRKTLFAAINLLRSTEYDPEAVARRALIAAVARVNERYPDKEYLALAHEIASRISDPAAHASALLLVYRMAADDADYSRTISLNLQQNIMAISIPVQKELLILDLAEEMVRSGRVNDLPDLLEEGLRTAAQIQIPFLADTFRSSLAAVYVRLFSGTGRESCLQRAGAAISGIIHEEIRVSAAGIHETLQPKIPPLYPEIKRAAEHLVTERYDMAEVLGLENLVRSAQERGAIARYFCSVAIIFNSTGKTRLARRFYDTSLAEAGVIRPLSRRAYVLCDLALMLETAGCTTKAMEVMDRAIDAATGIRQFSDRDEVFDNLAAAMQWMRGA